jgi:hypothetical protein|tara:strand:+ start:262 stop:510 length:249 start_codon:yes stop_codon:yes gene_type:complete
MDSEINSPSHYNANVVETIEIIQYSMSAEEFQGYLKGNIIKYVSRHKHKHPAEPYKDLCKAQWYLNRLVETYNNFTLEKEDT